MVTATACPEACQLLDMRAPPVLVPPRYAQRGARFPRRTFRRPPKRLKYRLQHTTAELTQRVGRATGQTFAAHGTPAFAVVRRRGWLAGHAAVWRGSAVGGQIGRRLAGTQLAATTAVVAA